MKLSLLLAVLGLKLGFQSLFSRGFRQEHKDKEFTLVIRSEKEGTAHTYYVRKGFVLSRPGACNKPDTELLWCDADTAVRTMLSENELDIYSTIGSGKLKIKGNFANALSFVNMAG